MFTGASLAAAIALKDEKSGEAGVTLSAFAGASADGKVVANVEWSNGTTSAFSELAAVGANAGGSVGVGVEEKFNFSFKDGKVTFVTGVMATLGIGGKAGLVFEIGADKAVELFSHMFRSVDWHRVDSVTLLAFEFYANVAFAQFIAAGKAGKYVFNKVTDFTGWFSDQKQSKLGFSEVKMNIRANVNDTQSLKDSPPETLGHLLLTITALPQRRKRMILMRSSKYCVERRVNMNLNGF